jgi:uncharacterized protein YndB with AHSA1/START domain
MTPDHTIALTLSRVFDAPRDRVFRAWAEPEFMRRWMGPRPAPLDLCEMDFREGGRYRYGFEFKDGSWMYVNGVFELIKVPEKMVFTWQWEHDSYESLITVEFADQGSSTLVTLVHSRLLNQAELDGHAHGWQGSFDKLAAVL